MPTTIYTYESISGSQWNNPSYADRDDGNRASKTASANSSIPAITASGSMYCSSGTDIIGMSNVTISKVEFGLKGYVSGSNCTLNLECYPPGSSWSSGGSITATSETTIWSDKTSAITWTDTNIDDTQAQASGSNSDSKNSRTAYVNCFLLRVTWSWSKTYTGAGDVAFSGAASTGVVFACSGSGDISFSGVAIAVLSAVAYTGSGGIVLGGSATASVILSCVGTGGISFSGAAVKGITFTCVGAGGITFSGSAVKGIVFSYTGQGGIAVSGSAATSATGYFAYTGAGSLVLQGGAAAGISLSYEGQGGISFSGSAASAMVIIYSYTGSGGTAFSGSAITGIVFAVTGSGGVTWVGGATVSYWCLYVYIGSGSLSVAGNAPITLILSWIGDGGIFLTGAATASWVPVFAYTGSGYITFSGSSPSGTILSYTGSGGIVCTGSAVTGYVSPSIPIPCLTSTSRDVVPLTGMRIGVRVAMYTGQDGSAGIPVSARAGARPSCVTVTTKDIQDTGYRTGARISPSSCTDIGHVPPLFSLAGTSLVLTPCVVHETGGSVVVSTALRYPLIYIMEMTMAPPSFARAGSRGFVSRETEITVHPDTAFRSGSRMPLSPHEETNRMGAVGARSNVAGITVTATEYTLLPVETVHTGASVELSCAMETIGAGSSSHCAGSRHEIPPLHERDDTPLVIAVSPAHVPVIMTMETSSSLTVHRAGIMYHAATLSVIDLLPDVNGRAGARISVAGTEGYDAPLPITILTAREIHLLVNSIISIDRTGPHSPVIIPLPPSVVKDRVRYSVRLARVINRRTDITGHVTLKTGLRRTLRVTVAGYTLLRPGNPKGTDLWIYPDDEGVSLVIECAGSIEVFDTIELLVGSPRLTQTLTLPASREGRSTIVRKISGQDLQGGPGYYIIYGRLRKNDGVVLHTDPVALWVRPYWS